MDIKSGNAVHIRNLGYSYPNAAEKCFQQLNLQVAEGARFGIFGPNGAGKTTLMNCMTGLIQPDNGTIDLLGFPIHQNKQTINQLFGFVPQDFSFYHELTPIENLQFFGAWSGMRKAAIKQRTEELLEILDLIPVRNKVVQQFSGGMKRKVNLAIGVIHDPAILFLDEPTVGVDVQTRHAIINYLKLLNSKGTTLIYTSHQLHEAEELCDNIALIDKGKIVAHDSLDRLTKQYGQLGLEGLFINLTGKPIEQD